MDSVLGGRSSDGDSTLAAMSGESKAFSPGDWMDGALWWPIRD